MIYFISDVHLGLFPREQDKLREDILLSFLNIIRQDCKQLYIVGDLFDFWFEYKTVIPKYFYKTLSKLKELREQGIEIIYLMGNHDFGHQDFFENELDINIVKHDLNIEIEGYKFFISHGDGKVHNDYGYLILRKILRNKFSIKLFQSIHPDFGIKLASRSSKTSRGYTDKKDYGGKEGMEDFAKLKLEEGIDYVIMGHRHRAGIKEINSGYYVNLGDWISNPTYGRFENGNFELLNVKDLLDSI